MNIIKAMPLENGVIKRIEHVAANEGIPDHTVVEIQLNPAEGSNINIEIRLPEKDCWNGKFVGLGNGGAAGKINPDGLIRQVQANFAAATTDMGTAPDPDSGIGNSEVWKDFGFRATHLMTVTAKRVIRVFYGKNPDWSYFIGSSTGGQQALQEAQRYPEDYDGIVANVPAHCRTPLHAYFLWNYQILQKCPFSPDQEAGVIAACNEYASGKYVSDPRCTPKDIGNVVALALKKDPSLTPQHAEALRKLFDGPKHAITGERIFDGIPFGSAFDPAQNPDHLYLFRWVFGKDIKLTDIDFDSGIDTYTAALGPYLNADNPDLREFEKRGGKLLMLSGTADSIVPYHATLDYYEKSIEFFGSLEKVRSFFCFYLIPGLDHGNGGPGINRRPDLFRLLVDWRENGMVPGEIRGGRYEEDQLIFDIPLYPYPEKTVRNGVSRVASRFLPTAKE